MGTAFYNIAGTVNTAFILLSLLGVGAQLRLVRNRRERADATDSATAVLSLNQFTVSFLAYLSFFVYGYSVTPFNHFIVWPRLLASVLVMAILVEIWRDRRNRSATTSVLAAALLLICALTGLAWGDRHADEGRVVASAMIVAITALLAQGYTHQILLILRNGHTGAVSLRMSQWILLMDLSTIVFAFAMGLRMGWPLLLLAVVSGSTKLVILYLFRWQQGTSARARRSHTGAPA
ncbi:MULTISPECIES: hypothetical protein [Pseudomonadota]|uniref:hypothetical protein n=1 Tax=Pseudomonadota TaxID=1224 RepID=UPI0003FC7BE8|nr:MULTISPECIES: hypothetical protein [Pseudomonadota]AVH91577.1 hypothetical protein AL480_12315 [Stenotrophomonas maltophilia]ELK2667902.1 hypothetical protein [Stenotrophomonas maltophilia]KOO73520.1 hypothetical protein VK66_13265 [Stenotrophomonas maltophilia]KUJ03009.1 hypothetical protein AR275_30240 [Stenotrophomonas maltophilia]MBB5531674.1 uncharacterized protein with PQ loop repeat [Stenotrophomonas maltophilia]